MDVVELLPPDSWFPASPAAEEHLAALEQRVGHPLPADLRELHRRCAEVSLAEERYHFLSPEAIRPVAELQVGEGASTEESSAALYEEAVAGIAPDNRIWVEPRVLVVHGPEAVVRIDEGVFGDVPQLVRRGDMMFWTDVKDDE